MLVTRSGRETATAATDITWTWTYAKPPLPEATCSIDKGVGTVINGQTTSVMINTVTTYTLTCTNSLGTSSRPLVINTGTPEGVALSGKFPYLAPGDIVECEIDGIGRQRQVIGKG